MMARSSSSAPAFFEYSKRGGIGSHLTRDHLPNPRLFAIGLPHSFSAVGASVLRNFNDINPTKCGLRGFFNTNDVLYLCQRDVLSDANSQSSKRGLYVNTHAGRMCISVEEFMDYVRAAQPDIVAVMSDEVGHYTGKSRVRKAVDRSIAWLNECLESSDQLADNIKLYAAIQGGTNAAERTRCCTSMANKPVQGFVIGGLDMGEDRVTRNAMLDICQQYLPADKIKLLTTQGRPDIVIDAVERGVRYFTCSYPLQVTEQGCALTFSVSNATTTKVNLRDPRFTKDASSLVQECLHNIHHYTQFFEGMKECFSGDNAQEWERFKHQIFSMFHASPPPTHEFL